MKVFRWGFLAALAVPLSVRSSDETFNAGRLGEVSFYRAEGAEAKGFVLFLSGSGGWNRALGEAAKNLAALGTAVVGINTPAYLKNLAKTSERCHYPAADLESLSHLVQKKFDFKHYVSPTLAGISSGATLAYVTLAQSPSNTFRGAVSLGFGPRLEIDKIPCKGNGLETQATAGKAKVFEARPSGKLENPWWVIQGSDDKVFGIEKTKAFVAKTPDATLVEMPGVGHDLGPSRNWLPKFKEAFGKIEPVTTAPAQDSELPELPLVELPAKNEGQGKAALIVVLSGDGGWASLDKDLAKAFHARGYAVVGVDSLKYFWQAKNPEVLGQDLAKVAAHYLKAWKKTKLLWVGYSMGADVLPFAIARLPKELRAKTLGAAYLGLSSRAEFEFHLSNWLGSEESGEGPSTAEEIAKLKELKNLCVRGDSEDESGCDGLKAPAKTVRFPGGHHFGGAYDKIAEMILKEM